MPTSVPKALFLIVTALGVMVSEAAFASSSPPIENAAADVPSVLRLQGLTAQLPFPTPPGLNRGDREQIRDEIENCMDEDDRDDRRDCFDDLRQEQAEDWNDRQNDRDDRQEEIENCLNQDDRDDRRDCFDDLRKDRDDWRSQRHPLDQIQFGGWQPRFPTNGFPRF